MPDRRYDVWCTDCGCLMKLRRGKYGPFYGCTAFPHCRNTMTTKDGALQQILDSDNEEVGDDFV